MAGEMLLAKCLMDLKEKLAKVTFALFVLSILTSAAATTLVANASGAISLSPTQGQAGISVNVYGAGFDGMVFIKFDTTDVATTFPSDMYGSIAATFIIPSVSSGTYNVTASDTKGDYAKTTFTVTLEAPTPTPTSSGTFPTPTPTVTPTSPEATTQYPTYRPYQSPAAKGGGFWSPLVIAAVVAATLAVVVPVTVVVRRRGKRETLLDKEPLPYRSEPPTPTNRPTLTSRYNQPSVYGQQLTKPVVTDRSSQPSSYAKPPPYAKTCPRCKRIVKDDYNICPYCDKRLK
jgi:hypothetical protein